MTRDFDKSPYSADEKLVAEFLFERGAGGGDDPIGFILASYAYVVAQRNELKAETERLRRKSQEYADHWWAMIRERPDWRPLREHIEMAASQLQHVANSMGEAHDHQ